MEHGNGHGGAQTRNSELCWALPLTPCSELGSAEHTLPPPASIIRSISAPAGTFSAHVIESPARCRRRQGRCHGPGQGWRPGEKQRDGEQGRELRASRASAGALTPAVHGQEGPQLCCPSVRDVGSERPRRESCSSPGKGSPAPVLPVCGLYGP